MASTLLEIKSQQILPRGDEIQETLDDPRVAGLDLGDRVNLEVDLLGKYVDAAIIAVCN